MNKKQEYSQMLTNKFWRLVRNRHLPLKMLKTKIFSNVLNLRNITMKFPAQYLGKS